MTLNRKQISCLSLITLLSYQGLNAQSSFAINFNNDLGGPGAAVSDFQSSDITLADTANFFAINNNGVGAETGFIDFRTGGTEGALTSGFLSISTVGEPQNDGFAVPAASYNFNDPILGSNLFDTEATSLGIDVSGISNLSSGATFVITAWGIGDNPGQQVLFEASYGADVQTGLTRFNELGSTNQSDSTGSVPFVQFTFTADGTTDLLTLRNFISTDSDTSTGGNGGRTHFNALSFSVVGEATQPGVSIASANETVSGAFTLDVTFSEDVTGFDATDLVITNGAASAVSPASGPASNYTVTITPSATGSVAIDLPSGIAQNATNDDNQPSNSLEVLAVLAGSEQANVTLSTSAVDPVREPYTLDIIFDEDVEGLDLGDFTVINGAISDLLATNDSVYTATVTPTAVGTVQVTLPPTATLELSNFDETTFTVDVQFSENVTGLEVSDFVIVNGVASGLENTLEETAYTVLVTPNDSGFVSISLPPNSVTDLDGDSLTNPQSNLLILQTGPLTLPASGASLTFEAESFTDSLGINLGIEPEASGFLFVDGVAESGSDPADGDFIRFEVESVNPSLTYELNIRHRRNGGGVNINADATIEVYACTETEEDTFTHTLLGSMTALWQDQGWPGILYYQSATDPDAIVFNVEQAAALQFQLPAGTTHLQFEFASVDPATTTARLDSFTITAVPGVQIVSSGLNANNGFDLNLSGLDTTIAYELRFSPDLESEFILIPGTSRIPETANATYTDPFPPLPGRGFYQLFVSP